MGDPKKTRKQFRRPLKIWDSASLESEKQLVQGYGLRNKREIWKTETQLRKKRKNARSLLALPLEERLKREKDLMESLARLGILNEKATLDDVLTLKVDSFLERRLQTIVWRKGLANTASQARQFITHGHIAIDSKRVTAPSYLVSSEEEKKIGYYGGKKMVLRPVVKEKKEAKKQFEEAKPAEEKEAGKEEKPQASAKETLEAVRKARGKEEKPAEEKEAGKKEKPAESKGEKKPKEKEAKAKKAEAKEEKEEVPK